MDNSDQQSVFGKITRSLTTFTERGPRNSLLWNRPPKTPDAENGVELDDAAERELEAAKARFYAALTTPGNPPSSAAILTDTPEFEWYLRFIDAALEDTAPFIKAAIKDAGSTIRTKVLLFDALADIAKVLTLTDKPSLTNIVTAIPSILLAPNTSIDIQCILVFRIVGWLTMFYVPVDSTESTTEPHVAITTDSTNCAHQLSMSLTDNGRKAAFIPLRQLLGYLGISIPPPRAAPPNPDIRVDVFSEQLVGSYLNYHTLQRVAGIRIVWVNYTSAHLEFDEQRRELKLFRFPSFSFLLCARGSTGRTINATQGAVDHVSYLARIFNEPSLQQRDINSFQSSLSFRPLPTAPDYHREILLSYRLLFDHDPSRSSWKRNCRAELSDLDRRTADPLLTILCSKETQSKNIYRAIHAVDTQAQYSAYREFPFLAERLLKVQAFVVAQNPSDWGALWHDRRDSLRFYTFWAVVVVGGASLVLSLFQTVLGVLQVMYGAKQSNQ